MPLKAWMPEQSLPGLSSVLSIHQDAWLHPTRLRKLPRRLDRLRLGLQLREDVENASLVLIRKPTLEPTVHKLLALLTPEIDAIKPSLPLSPTCNNEGVAMATCCPPLRGAAGFVLPIHAL